MTAPTVLAVRTLLSLFAVIVFVVVVVTPFADGKFGLYLVCAGFVLYAIVVITFILSIIWSLHP